MKPLASLLCAAAAAAAMTAAAAQTPSPGASDRMLEVELREGGEIVAAPTIRIRAGRPAAVSVGAYSLRFRIDQAAGAGPYVIRSSLYRSEGGWTRIAAPVLTVAEGEQASARFAGGDGSTFSLAVLVR